MERINFDLIFDQEKPDMYPTLKDVDMQYILYTLERVDGNKTRACTILDIDKNTMKRKLEKMGKE